MKSDDPKIKKIKETYKETEGNLSEELDRIKKKSNIKDNSSGDSPPPPPDLDPPEKDNDNNYNEEKEINKDNIIFKYNLVIPDKDVSIDELSKKILMFKEAINEFLHTYELWYGKDFLNFLKISNKLSEKDENNRVISDMDYLKAVPNIVNIIAEAQEIRIEKIEKGSIHISVIFVIIETSILPLLSSYNLPFGITARIICGLAHIFYNKNEKGIDDFIKNKISGNQEKKNTNPDKLPQISSPTSAKKDPKQNSNINDTKEKVGIDKKKIFEHNLEEVRRADDNTTKALTIYIISGSLIFLAYSNVDDINGKIAIAIIGLIITFLETLLVFSFRVRYDKLIQLFLDHKRYMDDSSRNLIIFEHRSFGHLIKWIYLIVIFANVIGWIIIGLTTIL